MKEKLIACAATVMLAGGSTPPESVPAAARILDFMALPSELPQAVDAQIPQVRAIKLDIDTHTKQHLGGGMVAERHIYNGASGVRLVPGVYVTAGHVINQKNGTPRPGTERCGSITINGPSIQPIGQATDENNRTYPLRGESLNAVRAVGQNLDAGNYSKVPDIALVQTDETDSARSRRRLLGYRVAGRVAINEPLFFINYGDTERRLVRDPYELNLTEKGIHMGLNAPAEFAGVPDAYLPNGTLDVIVGTKGYGELPEPLAEPGDSGGPVYDTAGRLIGISDRAGPKVPARSLEASKHVILHGVRPDTLVQEVIVQPLTHELLAELSVELAAAAPCESHL